MAGRPKTQYQPISRPLNATLGDGTTFLLTDIPILCPKCESPFVDPYGSQLAVGGGSEKFQCKNLDCPFLTSHAQGHQFNIRTSARFQQALAAYLANILKPLARGTMSQSALAGQIHRSPALVTYLRLKVEARLQELGHLQKLVLATGYRLLKVLGVKGSLSRDETAMRAVFDEAERNNGKEFAILTIEAWGRSQKMAKNLGRPVTVVIHKH